MENKQIVLALTSTQKTNEEGIGPAFYRSLTYVPRWELRRLIARLRPRGQVNDDWHTGGIAPL